MAPTHRVRHAGLGEANIYVSPRQQAALDGHNTEARDRARQHVCIRFREACKAKAGASWNWVDGQPFINWNELAITKLPLPEAPSAATPVVTVPPRAEGSCCDDENCVVCDQGNHGFCRKGCTL
ncbi:MAG TPA: hypothetical protein VFZ62_00160 [Candidatus Saccharimonadales bacterium]